MIHHVMMINGIEGIRHIMGRKVGNMIEFYIYIYIYNLFNYQKNKNKTYFLLAGVKMS